MVVVGVDTTVMVDGESIMFLEVAAEVAGGMGKVGIHRYQEQQTMMVVLVASTRLEAEVVAEAAEEGEAEERCQCHGLAKTRKRNSEKIPAT